MLPHADIVSAVLGAGSVGVVIGVLAGIALSRGARIVELRDFWRRGYTYARREQDRRRERDAMAEPFGDMPVLEKLVGLARDRKMTPAEIAAQRRSWEVGNVMLEQPEMSRSDATAIVDKVMSHG